MASHHKLLFWILLVALAFRLLPLNQSLWLDEAINVVNARDHSFTHLITNYALGDFHPPAFHPILHIWIRLFGDSEIAVRLPSLIFGLLTITITFFIGRLTSPSKSITLFHLRLNLRHLPAILLATSGLHLYYSTEARMYSLAAFATSAAIYCLLSLFRYHHISLSPLLHSPLSSLTLFFRPYSLLFIASYTLALYTDYLPWFLLPLFFILLPFHTLTSLILTTPWWPLFYQQLHIGLTTATTHPGWSQVVGGFSLRNLLLIPIKFTIGRVSARPPLLYAVLLFLPLISITVALVRSFATIFTQPKLKSLIIACWLVVPLILGTLFSLRISLLSYFRFLFILPAFYLLISYGLAQLPQVSRNLVIILLITNLISSTTFIFNPAFHKEDWRSFSNWIDQVQTDSAVTVFPDLAQAAPYLYYQQQVPALDSIRQTDSLPDAVYLVRYVQEIFDPTDSKKQDIEALGYTQVHQLDFNGVIVWVYTRSHKLFAQVL